MRDVHAAGASFYGRCTVFPAGPFWLPTACQLLADTQLIGDIPPDFSAGKFFLRRPGHALFPRKHPANPVSFLSAGKNSASRSAGFEIVEIVEGISPAPAL
ncbi:MAG: hypothetical protein U1F65_04525 [Verrucomicrobiota bacterium]